MLFSLFPLFVLIPLLEFFLLFKVAGEIGFGSTLLIVVLTAFVGLKLLRQQGMDTFKRFQHKAQQSEIPMHEVAEGLLLFFAGGLLLTPGLITDCLGFIILIPGSRKLIVAFFARSLKDKFSTFGFGADNMMDIKNSARHHNNEGVIEAEYEDITDKSNRD